MDSEKENSAASMATKYAVFNKWCQDNGIISPKI